MTSTPRSLSRDEAAANSPLRNAFASSSTKPLHSPFLSRRSRISNGSPYTRLNPPSSQAAGQPDAISTSSSTLVNADNTSDYRPWEVRSESGSSSYDSLADIRGGRAITSLSVLDDIGTLPSIHISPLPRRSVSRASTSDLQASTRPSNDSTRRSVDSSLTRARPARQLCPDDCRCSDQDIDLGLCRRVIGSSSSGSESGSLSVGVHPMRRKPADPLATSPPQLPHHHADTESNTANGVFQQGDQSQHSWHSISEPRSQGRDFEKDPILVPRSARSRGTGGGGRRSSISSYQHSFDQLQRGLDTLDSNESDADSDADQAQAAQRRAESMARWTARRSSLSQSKPNTRSLSTKVESPSEPHALHKSSPVQSAPRSLASDASMPRRTPDSKRTDDEYATPLLPSPLKATPGRKSIAAVFESMQKEREARAAEEHKQWQEKQTRRERERAARAFGVPLRRRTSASSSQMDSPGSASLVPDTPVSQGQTTAFHSMTSRTSPARSEAASVASASSPLLSSPGSPKVDDGAAVDVQPRHPVEEAAGRIPETLTEADEVSEDVEETDHRSQATKSEIEQEDRAAVVPTTPQPKHVSGFGFASQPMALDLSPVRSISDYSSPASSPRKNAHRRQNTNTISVAARLPSAPVAAAGQRFNTALSQGSETPVPQPAQQQAQESPRTPFPQTPTPTGGILSSVKKGLPQLSAARRGHSVRFSPRPDYRSDSGSWDESGAQSVEANDESDSRDAAVSRLLLPAKQITIPDILTSASMPASGAAAETDEDEEEEEDGEEKDREERNRPEGSASVQDLPGSRGSPPVKVEAVSQPHTPASPAVVTDPAAASFSQSVRFPGAYAATPVKQYSRHVIRPSPNVSRILPDVIPPAVRPSTIASAASSAAAAAMQYGLFPTRDSEGSHIPRESTPPPSASRSPSMLPPDDPRNSPRSPRPVNLGREQFARFDAGSSSSSSSEGSSLAGSVMVQTSTAANQNRGGGKDDGVNATISKILQTVEAAHGSKLKRLQLRQQLNGMGERVGRISEEMPVRSSAGSNGKLRGEAEEVARQDEADRAHSDELKRQIMHALAVLADRIVALQTHSHTDMDMTSTETAVDTKVAPRSSGRRGLSRRATLLLVVVQCALVAWLMALAERKAERMRMYHPSPQLSLLYSSNVQWNALASDPHLQPLLAIPLLHQLYHSNPPLPSPHHLHSFSHQEQSTLWQVYKTYIRLNGGWTLALQLMVYCVSQLMAYATLLVIAPLQVLWLVLAANDTNTAKSRFPAAV